MLNSNTQANHWSPVFRSSSSFQQPTEVNLIEIDPPIQPNLPKPEPSNVVNITLDDLTGGEGFGFQVVRPKSMMDVINYLDRCNEKHTWLMSQVSETRLQCQRMMYSSI
ncbi:hypothetical protein A0J61_08808 [Choanephora cucurbitarum]|uniref:Uncharacterized protein n=1 Tax=Choanephora cucurbitarum TaxID=101091 RepID=A0A1C7N206_9FUNG|nr:hypothetical protein A0J61_08808 [Choanephora cucurbitarum]